MKLKLNFISNSHDFLTTEQALFDPEYLLLTNYERKMGQRMSLKGSYVREGTDNPLSISQSGHHILIYLDISRSHNNYALHISRSLTLFDLPSNSSNG